MYQIGEFSILAETTVKTIRYYDKIGLLKPMKIDKFTNYRYYDDSQIDIIKKIKDYQKVGFQLDEIKNILNDENANMISKKIRDLEEENSTKIKILNKLRVNMKEKVEVVKNPLLPTITKYHVIKNRKEINDLYFNESDEFLKVFLNYEKEYKEENIKCEIGILLPDNIYKDKNKLSDLEHKYDKRAYIEYHPENYIHTITADIKEGYKDIIKYANKNKYQIRAPFIEIKNNDYYDIYIEAYDLKVTNEVSDNYNKSKENNLNKKLIKKPNKEFVGKWQLVGEITEPPKYFNPNEEHYIPTIKYDYIEIYKNTKTNYKELACIDNYLIHTTKDNKKFFSHISKTKYNNIITILMNTEESNSRPYEYYYRKTSGNMSR